MGTSNLKGVDPVGDTTPCECSADRARHGPRPRRVARPRAECQRPRGAFVRAIREACLDRWILFGKRRLRRAWPSRRTSIGSGTIRGSATRAGRASRPTQAERETVLRWDRGGDYVHVSSASPVIWAEARPARHPVDPETTCQGAVPGRCYGIPISRFHWRFKRGGTEAPGWRVANHARTAHLAPEAGSR